MSQIVVKGLSRKKIQCIADDIHAQLGIHNRAFPIVRLIEWLSAPNATGEPEMNLEIVEDSELPDRYAEYRLRTNTLVVRSSVYEGACIDNGRDRFTLAHELGHYLLHRNQSYSRSNTEYRAYEDPEWQANTFASMLLIPRNEIRGMSVEEIMRRYKVSRQAALIAMD